MTKTLLVFPSNREDFLVAGKFLLFFLISFIALDAIVNLIPLELFEAMFAAPTNFILNLLGFESSMQSGEPVLIFLKDFNFPIAISYLCTGLLEWIVLCSTLVASSEVNAKKRMIGLVGATVFVFLFNLTRILASILFIVFFGLSFAEFSHDVFFRVFLFFSIAGFYFFWLKNNA